MKVVTGFSHLIENNNHNSIVAEGKKFLSHIRFSDEQRKNARKSIASS